MNPRSQLVPVGEALALGELPAQMHAYVIRAGRFGVPTQSFVPERY